jgi:hypothetical protein
LWVFGGLFTSTVLDQHRRLNFLFGNTLSRL